MSTKTNMWTGEIPSDLKHGDECYLDFGDSGRIDECRVTKVAFTASQLWYDVAVVVRVPNVYITEVRMHNINGAYVFPKKASGNWLKRPVIIEAVRYTGDNNEAIEQFAGDAALFTKQIGSAATGAPHPQMYQTLTILTKEGEMECSVGDYLIKEPFPTSDRRFYPCKPDIFLATYKQI